MQNEENQDCLNSAIRLVSWIQSKVEWLYDGNDDLLTDELKLISEQLTSLYEYLIVLKKPSDQS